MLGWRRDEVLGQFLPTVPEDSKEEFASFRKRICSGKPIMGKDLVRRRKDGSRIKYSLYAAPEYDDDGKVIGVFQPTRIRPRFLERLRISGIVLPPVLFERETPVN